MKIRIIAMIAILSASTSVAFAAEAGRYATLSLGGFMPDRIGTAEVKYDNGPVGSAALGYAFANRVRLEGELSYREADMYWLDTGFFQYNMDSSISATSLMTNVYYDINTQSLLTPYLGAGVGASRVNLEKGNFVSPNIVRGGPGSFGWNEDHDIVLAYQLAAGVGLDVSKTITIDLGYRYFGTTDAKMNFAEVEFSSHNAMVGVKLKY